MGDRGGKKDKEKHKHQQVKKQQDDARNKKDKAQPKSAIAPSRAGAA